MKCNPFEEGSQLIRSEEKCEGHYKWCDVIVRYGLRANPIPNLHIVRNHSRAQVLLVHCYFFCTCRHALLADSFYFNKGRLIYCRMRQFTSQPACISKVFIISLFVKKTTCAESLYLRTTQATRSKIYRTSGML